MIYAFRHWIIPDHMMRSLRLYIDHGIPVGHFLTAVLENDLFEACGRADDDNINNLPAFVAFLYNEVTPQCYGSREKVRAWLKMHEARREAEEAAKPEAEA
jgi:hypothetical protein